MHSSHAPAFPGARAAAAIGRAVRGPGAHVPPGTLVATLGVTAHAVHSSPHGSDIWKVRLETGSLDRWLMLDAGRVLVQGRATPVLLLGRVKNGVPAKRFHEMKVVDGRGGSTLRTYDGTGSDYVDASRRTPGHESDETPLRLGPPRLRDVDGDGSDDVVFLEQDFIFGRLLRAVRIEPQLSLSPHHRRPGPASLVPCR
jgi:hypothetical protein